jgi:hypothetical protein
MQCRFMCHYGDLEYQVPHHLLRRNLGSTVRCMIYHRGENLAVCWSSMITVNGERSMCCCGEFEPHDQLFSDESIQWMNCIGTWFMSTRGDFGISSSTSMSSVSKHYLNSCGHATVLELSLYHCGGFGIIINSPSMGCEILIYKMYDDVSYRSEFGISNYHCSV